MRMLGSKVFANGSTTFPTQVLEALGVKAGDTVRFVVSGNSVQIVKAHSVSEAENLLARSDQS